MWLLCNNLFDGMFGASQQPCPDVATLSIWVTQPKVSCWGSPLHLSHHKGLSDTHVIPVDGQPYLEEEQQSDTSALNLNTHPSGQNAAFQHQYI